MLQAIFLVCKIIGIFLLSILGILILLLFLALFVPVRYKSKGKYYKTPLMDWTVSWLLHIITVRVKLDENGSKFTLKIFGITPSSKKKASKGTKTAKKRKAEPADKDFIETELKTPLETADPGKAEKVNSDRKEQELPRKQNFIERIFSKLKYTISWICDKLKTIIESFHSFMEFIKNEENKKVLKLIKKELFVILKHIKPKKLALKVRFGFEDPSNTGMLLGVVSMVKLTYQKNIQIIPDFENSIIEGEYSIRGRIYGITMLYVFLKLFLNKNLRSLVKQFMG